MSGDRLLKLKRNDVKGAIEAIKAMKRDGSWKDYYYEFVYVLQDNPAKLDRELQRSRL